MMLFYHTIKQPAAMDVEISTLPKDMRGPHFDSRLVLVITRCLQACTTNSMLVEDAFSPYNPTARSSG